MNPLLDKIKKTIEQLAHAKIYRNTLPHGIDLFQDYSRRFGTPDFKIIFDVGANVGQSALGYSEQFINAAIFSFEPVPTTYAALKKNTSHLSKVSSFNLALGSEAGELPMAINQDSRLNTLVITNSAGVTSNHNEMVSVSTLDIFAERHGVQLIDLLKIDTEGHDLNVLKGAEKMLSAGKINLIQVETGFGESSAHIKLNEFIEHLQRRGYALFGVYEQQPYWTGEPWLMYANAVFICKGLASIARPTCKLNI